MQPPEPIFPFLRSPIERWVSKRRLAVRLGVCPRTIDNWLGAGRIPRLKLPGGMVRFRPDGVERLMVDRVEALGDDPLRPTKDVPLAGKGDKATVAAIYGVSRRTVENWAKARLIPWQHLATGRVRFDLAEVEKALSRFLISGGTG